MLQDIVDEYVGKDFTQCKLASSKGIDVIGDLGHDELLIKQSKLLWIWNIETDLLYSLQCEHGKIRTSSRGFWVWYNNDTMKVFLKSQVVFQFQSQHDIMDIQIRQEHIWIETKQDFKIIDWKLQKIVYVESFEFCLTRAHLHRYEGGFVLHRRHPCMSKGIIHDRVLWSSSYDEIEVDKWKFKDYCIICEYGSYAMVASSTQWMIVDIKQGPITEGLFRFPIRNIKSMTNNRVIVTTQSKETFIFA